MLPNGRILMAPLPSVVSLIARTIQIRFVPDRLLKPVVYGCCASKSQVHVEATQEAALVSSIIPAANPFPRHMLHAFANAALAATGIAHQNGLQLRRQSKRVLLPKH